MKNVNQLQQREEYYGKGARRYGCRYKNFHWASVEILFNLIYTYDLTATHLARQLSAHELSLSAFNVLMILNRSEGKGHALRELSDLLLVTRANVTGLVDCLVERKLVERFEDKQDRRIRIARITTRGEKLLETILPDYYSMVREIARGLNKDEKIALNKLLTKMRESVQLAQRKTSATNE